MASGAADRPELTDGRRNHRSKAHAIATPDVLDGEGRYRDARILG